MQRPGQPLISGTGRRRASAPYSVRPQAAALHPPTGSQYSRLAACLEAVSTNCSRHGASHHQPFNFLQLELSWNHRRLLHSDRLEPCFAPPSDALLEAPQGRNTRCIATLRLRSRSYRVISSTATPSLHRPSTWPGRVKSPFDKAASLIIASVLPAGFHFILFLPDLT